MTRVCMRTACRHRDAGAQPSALGSCARTCKASAHVTAAHAHFRPRYRCLKQRRYEDRPGRTGMHATGGEEGRPSSGSEAEPASSESPLAVSSVVQDKPSAQRDVAAAQETGLPHRWYVVAAMVAAFVLCNMDKVNMSVAIIPMSGELSWSSTDRGLVSSAFFWGYAATQIPAGYIATRIGGAKVLLFGVVLWSLGTLVAPPLAEAGLFWLCVSRVLVGLGEGFAPSAVTNVMARLIPERERSRAVSYVFGGLDLGSVIGLLLCGPLIQTYGWPSVFYVFAVLGLAWAIVWPLCKPEQVDDTMQRETERLSEIEARARIARGGPATEADSSQVPYGKFMRTPAVWAVITAHFCFNWGYYTLLAWLPSYFDLALGLEVSKSSLLTLIPYLSMVCMTPFVGPVADGLISKGWTVTRVRKLCQTVSFVGPAICMLALSVLTPGPGDPINQNLTAAIVALMSVAFALGAWARAGLYCNHQDMSPKYASALLGISNTAGALPGVLGVSLAGILLDRSGSWPQAVFLPIAAVQLFGTVIYAIFGSSERRTDW